jgi:hypothetical protein
MQPMPSRFNVLARYNAEHARGVVHTPEWAAKMAGLQREYWQWTGILPQDDPGRAPEGG